jgi:hypothetical protein
MTSFIVDGMLGSLARKLRIYGFDVYYKSDDEDEKILLRAEREGRMILSKDKELCKRALLKGLEALYVEGEDDLEMLAFVFRSLGIERRLDLIDTRCPICNGELISVSKENLKGVPKGVLSRYEDFYRCKSCGQVYWEGSHWERLKQMDKRLHKLLAKGNL